MIQSEEKSPCLGCELEGEDKNGPACTNCEKRLRYCIFSDRSIRTDPKIVNPIIWGADDFRGRWHREKKTVGD